MEILLFILAPILFSSLLAWVFLSFFKKAEISTDILHEQSKKGSKSVLHHNFSYTVEKCMDGAKSTLEKHDMEVDCAKFIQKY